MDLSSPVIEQLREPSTKKKLWNAIDQLNSRGLVQSSSWASQMLMDLPAGDGEYLQSCPDPQMATIDHKTPSYLRAKGYFDTRQYRRSAEALKDFRTPHGRFLRMYSIYLAGERRKEEERQELADWTEPVNTELEPLRAELVALRDKRKLDAHLWYLLGVVLKRLKLKDEASKALQQSLSMFPYNWGAWLELVPLCETRLALGTLKIPDHWMKTLFIGHLLNEMDAADQARELYENLLTIMPLSRFAKRQLALSLYHLRMFDEAQQMYDELFEEDQYCLDGADVYSNILYVKEDKVQLSLLANRCMKVDKFRLETCCVIGNYYALRGQHDQALVYFQRALKLNRNYLSAWTLMGHEFLEMKNTKAACEAYRRAIDINPKDFRAWYGLGQTYELMNMPLYTLYYFEKAAALRPRDARMWCAVGQTLQELRRWDEAIRSYEQAMHCEDPEGEALAKLAFLYERMARESQREGRQSERTMFCMDRAAKCYTTSLAHRDELKLGDQESADALRFLTDYWYTKGDLAQAKQYCSRLPDYPGHDKEFVKTLLRQIHDKETQEM